MLLGESIKKYNIKLLFILIILCFSGWSLYSNTNLNSFYDKIENLDKKKKVDRLNNLAFKIRINEPKKCIKLSKKALKLSKNLRYKYGKMHSYSNSGLGHYYLSNYKKAMINYKKSFKIAFDNNYKDELASLYN